MVGGIFVPFIDDPGFAFPLMQRLVFTGVRGCNNLGLNVRYSHLFGLEIYWCAMELFSNSLLLNPDGHVGKTCIVNSYVTRTFFREDPPRVGVLNYCSLPRSRRIFCVNYRNRK